jgi:hypothetical protein
LILSGPPSVASRPAASSAMAAPLSIAGTIEQDLNTLRSKQRASTR